MQKSLQATWSECYKKKKKLCAAIDDGGGGESQREWVSRKAWEGTRKRAQRLWRCKTPTLIPGAGRTLAGGARYESRQPTLSSVATNREEMYLCSPVCS